MNVNDCNTVMLSHGVSEEYHEDLFPGRNSNQVLLKSKSRAHLLKRARLQWLYVVK